MLLSAIDLAPVLNDVIVPTLVPTVAAVGGWLVKKLASLLNIKLDEGQRAVVDRGLEMALAYAVQKLRVSTQDSLKVDIKSATIALAATYATAHIPDALKYFNIDGVKLANMIEARLPSVDGTAVVPAAVAKV